MDIEYLVKRKEPKMRKVLNFVNFIICIATFSQTIDGSLAIKRGPHHPRSEPVKTRKVDQHLTHEEHPIEDDLRNINVQANLDEMSDEERTFYFFKAHDNDNNNALDGLELLYAGMHTHEVDNQSFKRDERDNYLEEAQDELQHIIEVIDKFLQIADSNNDGLLHYAEYVKAVTGASTEPTVAAMP